MTFYVWDQACQANFAHTWKLCFLGLSWSNPLNSQMSNVTTFRKPYLQLKLAFPSTSFRLFSLDVGQFFSFLCFWSHCSMDSGKWNKSSEFKMTHQAPANIGSHYFSRMLSVVARFCLCDGRTYAYGHPAWK